MQRNLYQPDDIVWNEWNYDKSMNRKGIIRNLYTFATNLNKGELYYTDSVNHKGMLWEEYYMTLIARKIT